MTNRKCKPPQEALEYRSIPEPNSGCVIWIGATGMGGYGRINVNGKLVSAHRFAWEQSNGPIPEGEGYHGTCVLHTCDNPSCVNPEHLFLGTNQDNQDDMIAKSRDVNLKGEDHSLSKLTEADVIAIRADTRLQKEIAADYGVGQTQIGRIKRRKSWKHIEGEL